MSRKSSDCLLRLLSCLFRQTSDWPTRSFGNLRLTNCTRTSYTQHLTCWLSTVNNWTVVALTPALDPHLRAAQITQNSKVPPQKNCTARQKNCTARQKNTTARYKNCTAPQNSKVPLQFFNFSILQLFNFSILQFFNFIWCGLGAGVSATTTPTKHTDYQWVKYQV